MKIAVSRVIEAPPDVVFRFFTQLDHLRFVCAGRRREWCEAQGIVVSLNADHEVYIKQGKHGLRVKFRTVRFEQDALLENEFLSWPLKGARHLQTFEEAQEGTLVTDVNTWEPQWYLRAIVSKNEEEQTAFFEEKLDNAGEIIESVYRLRAERAFESGIFQDAEDAGIDPIITEDD